MLTKNQAGVVFTNVLTQFSKIFIIFIDTKIYGNKNLTESLRTDVFVCRFPMVFVIQKIKLYMRTQKSGWNRIHKLFYSNFHKNKDAEIGIVFTNIPTHIFIILKIHSKNLVNGQYSQTFLSKIFILFKGNTFHERNQE